MNGRRKLTLLGAALAAIALVTTPAVHAKAKRVIKQAVKTLCTDTSVVIPDGPEFGDYAGGAVSTGRGCPKKMVCGYGGLPLGARVVDVDAGIRVAHPSVGDLSVLVVSPVGALTALTAPGTGGAAADFGAGATGCAGSFTTLDDEAGASIRTVTPAQAPFAGSFRPHQPLSIHDGSFGAGDWRFFFDDTVAGGAGTVEALSLRLHYEWTVHKKKKGKKKKKRGRKRRG